MGTSCKIKTAKPKSQAAKPKRQTIKEYADECGKQKARTIIRQYGREHMCDIRRVRAFLDELGYYPDQKVDSRQVAAYKAMLIRLITSEQRAMDLHALLVLACAMGNSIPDRRFCNIQFNKVSPGVPSAFLNFIQNDLDLDGEDSDDPEEPREV